MLRPAKYLCAAATAALLGSCTTKPPRTDQGESDLVVLAEVNGESVTRGDVERMISNNLGEQTAERLGAEGRKRVLESLVQAKAVAQARDKEMSETERAELERRVAAYRDDVLIKQYLGKHTTTAPVSAEQVQAYYTANAARFGQKHVRTYEMVASAGALDAATRAPLMKALSSAATEKDWGAWVTALKAKGHPLVYRRGQDDDAILDSDLRKLIRGAPKDAPTPLTLLGGVAYLVRITGERTQPARPLSEVEVEIRKTLQPLQVKQAVQQATEQVMKTAEVKYR